jgi:hypothetical protein
MIDIDAQNYHWRFEINGEDKHYITDIELRKNFITAAKWRDRQIDKILEND